MSAQALFKAPRPYALVTYVDLLRPRLAVMRVGVLVLATAGALGIAPVSQARPDTDQPTSCAEAAVTTAPATARLSPWRDAWYLDDQPAGTPADPAHPLDFSPRTHDDWMLPGTASRSSIDVSPRTHDDWMLRPQPQQGF